MEKMMRITVLVSLLVMLFSTNVMAQKVTEFDYPELMVTPKASERIKLEYKREKRRGMWMHLPIQVSSVATLTASAFQLMDYDESKDPDGYSPYAGLITGGFWLGVTAYLGEIHRPYMKGFKEIAKMPAKTPRQQLIRERMAEEAIYDIEKLGTKLVWFSSLTNLGASVYMASKAESKSAALLASSISAILALGPVVFPHPWRQTGNYHREYKKKIYRPIASGAMLYNKSHGVFVPGMKLSMSF